MVLFKKILSLVFYSAVIGFLFVLLGLGIGISWLPSLVFGLALAMLAIIGSIRGLRILPGFGLFLGALCGLIFSIICSLVFGLIFGLLIFVLSSVPYAWRALKKRFFPETIM